MILPANLQLLAEQLEDEIRGFYTNESMPGIIDVQLNYITAVITYRAPNGSNLLHHYVVLEHLLMAHANAALREFSQTCNQNASLINQQNSPALHRAIRYNNLICQLNGFIIARLDIRYIKESRTTIRNEIQNSRQFRSEIHQRAFDNILQILDSSWLGRQETAHIYFQKAWLWSMLKTVFYTATDNRFFALYANLANILRNSNQTILLRVERSNDAYNSFTAKAFVLQTELDAAAALPATNFQLTAAQQAALADKNALLRTVNIQEDNLITPDLYARLLNRQAATGLNPSLVYAGRTENLPEREEILSALFSGFILFNHDEILSYYPPAIITAHELQHIEDFLSGRDLTTFPLANHLRAPRMWSNSAAELYATLAHPIYSEHDLFNSMGLSPGFRPRIFYTQPLIFFSAFTYLPFDWEHRTVRAATAIFGEFASRRFGCNIS